MDHHNPTFEDAIKLSRVIKDWIKELFSDKGSVGLTNTLCPSKVTSLIRAQGKCPLTVE
jgi:hypothetical protein